MPLGWCNWERAKLALESCKRIRGVSLCVGGWLRGSRVQGWIEDLKACGRNKESLEIRSLFGNITTHIKHLVFPVVKGQIQATCRKNSALNIILCNIIYLYCIYICYVLFYKDLSRDFTS